MRKLASYLVNPFDDPQISLAELVAFATDNVQRMISNNPGNELDERITATNSAITLVESTATHDTVKLGIRKARKQTKMSFRRDVLPGGVARIEASIISAVGVGSAISTEALPLGRNIFQTCRDDQVSTHLQTLLTAVTTHQAVLPALALTQATNLMSTWAANYQDSETASGNKSVSEAEKRAARQNLQLMLYLNLVKLMEMFLRQPEKLSLYMMQHLLENPSSSEEEEEPPPPPTPPTPTGTT